MSKKQSSGISGRLGGTLSLAMSIFRPTQSADHMRVKQGAAFSKNMNGAMARPVSAAPKCRPLNAAEMNELERLSSMRAALYPKD
ncbi:hypothetical protein JQU17_18200 [Ponticoccus sp. SC2-23]|uniref:hypothetical protein n=1 Tax=Alexandriicola marinus TaxID=2081710 RepID=UPI000FD74967|nr:hypothetical protein [Alexandriicola marinus]MBM1222309.1 hypothetical protein [Ponticoccus sp. SC6-9]MBM1224422.1 hypothetical protein [Ponticoccus sp. SC6-15]MBM1229798.1 hypothetical protein [Ponticoccus sp. SC6-38]MBM1233388.1 hypothetical protein [Ponticoccus sp. SC6-45]MBM1236662.1 hypothetical protein [Ponticoccus sp. SC6-49]MBM1244706.1 hypothetical protein [Ponticoccus sp. SC2-64]MBM1246912.1 hypothetical protein [Ponticoccus sp. SC6-42]MBM1251390.1 hypothetical protein [Pontico